MRYFVQKQPPCGPKRLPVHIRKEVQTSSEPGGCKHALKGFRGLGVSGFRGSGV